MLLVDASNVADYLRSSRRVERGAPVRVEPLSGGVSNIVLRIEPQGGAPFVLKQSRERLRTAAPWFSRLDRIWRETAAMSALAPLLPAGVIPRILFEDRENYLFAMEAVDPRHIVWKEELLAGRVRPEIAVRLASYLSTIHAKTHDEPAFERDFGDREVFVQLRVDPFYRSVAAAHAGLRIHFDRLVEEMWNIRTCLVHADFSPKNVLVINGPPLASAAAPLSAAAASHARIALVDFETCHYGDPAFDLGFFLSHLLLKGVRAEGEVDQFVDLIEGFWHRYVAGIEPLAGDPDFEPRALERRAIAHLAGCALARIDGTSPVAYLPGDRQRAAVRQLCVALFEERIDRIAVVGSLLQTSVESLIVK